MAENDKAVSVQLADGSEHHCDIAISAADDRTTIFDMLDGKYVSGKIQGYYDELPPSCPVFYLSQGVDHTFDEMSHQVTGIDSPLINRSQFVKGKETVCCSNIQPRSQSGTGRKDSDENLFRFRL